MSGGESKIVAGESALRVALADLCRPFAPEGSVPGGELVAPDAIPEPAAALLVHHNHMTEVLEQHYDSALKVRVLREELSGEIYSRMIHLSLASNDRVVEWGIARLNFQHLSDQVRQEILARRLPLGAILVSHNVHRRVQPRCYMRFPADSQVFRLFSQSSGAAVYGRVGTIYCNHEPAIELLEIVV